MTNVRGDARQRTQLSLCGCNPCFSGVAPAWVARVGFPPVSTYFHTYLRIGDDRLPVDAVNEVVSILRKRADAPADARVQYFSGGAWLRIEHLGFNSLKKSTAVEVVADLAQQWRGEIVMLAAQTTASCAAYAHYANGTLQRFLSAGDDHWFEIHGEAEPWESRLFSREFAWTYAIGENSPFHDGVLRDVAACYGLPGRDAQHAWQIDRALMD